MLSSGRRNYITKNGVTRKQVVIEAQKFPVICCADCLRKDPPVRNHNVLNKKRKLCATHYREYRREHACSVEGCGRIIKNKESKKCARHLVAYDVRVCVTEGCETRCNKRKDHCDRCYLREYRREKRRRIIKEEKEHWGMSVQNRLVFSTFPAPISLRAEELGSKKFPPMSLYIINNFVKGEDDIT
jgi:hypothetical protein